MQKEIFAKLAKHNYEELVFFNDTNNNLKVIFALHNTKLGPAAGGCRFYDYQDEEAAIKDVLRLAKAMTYKNATSGLSYGGGKCVIIGDPKKIKNEFLLTELARYLTTLHGRFILGKDVGMSYEDMLFLSSKTQYICGTQSDGSKFAALTVFQSMKTAIQFLMGKDETLANKTVAIQGVGAVGSYLVEFLSKEKCKILISDINEESIKKIKEKFDVEVIANDKILSTECDILAPCALGGIINSEIIPQLKCKIIAGSANNQLEDEEKDGKALHEAKILFAPDYVINAGGSIASLDSYDNYDEEITKQKYELIQKRLMSIFEISKKNNTTTTEEADKVAEEYIEKMENIDNKFS